MQFMKSLTLFTVFAFVFTLGAFAKDLNSGNFDLMQTARIGSTVLQPGHYKAEWTGSNGEVQVSIMQHGKTVATSEARLKESPSKSPYNAVGFLNDSGPNQQIREIDFDQRTESLVFSGS